jgi:CYTH domain
MMRLSLALYLIVILCSTSPFHLMLVKGFAAAPSNIQCKITSVSIARSKSSGILETAPSVSFITSSSSSNNSRSVSVQHQMSPSSSSSDVADASIATETGTSNLEVERKFSLLGADLNSLADRLRQAGLKEAGCKEMVDWYFDDCSPFSSTSSSSSSLQYPLIRQDCWLRYRTIVAEENGSTDNNSGTWQLKRGRKVNQNSSGTTVYEEIEGEEALKITQTLLPSRNSGSSEEDASTTTSSAPTTPLFDGLFHVPPITISGMQPFARITTKRSSWIMSSNDHDTDSSCSSSSSSSSNLFGLLTVDLDTTDYGHAIGEVEAVVTNAKDVAMAQAKVDDLVKQLQVGSDGAMGKLEYYLKLKRPEILQIILAGKSTSESLI